MRLSELGGRTVRHPDLALFPTGPRTRDRGQGTCCSLRALSRKVGRGDVSGHSHGLADGCDQCLCAIRHVYHTLPPGAWIAGGGQDGADKDLCLAESRRAGRARRVVCRDCAELGVVAGCELFGMGGERGCVDRGGQRGQHSTERVVQCERWWGGRFRRTWGQGRAAQSRVRDCDCAEQLTEDPRGSVVLRG